MDNWQNYPVAYPYSQFYAPSPWDIPNRFSLGMTYLLPGDELSNGIARRIAGGWTLAGTVALQSGYPFTVKPMRPSPSVPLLLMALRSPPRTMPPKWLPQICGSLRAVAISMPTAITTITPM